jgi:hypothetical protein
MIGFNLADAQIEDIAIKITHNMFMSSVHVHNMSGKHVCNFNNSSISPPTLHRKDGSTIVKINDILIPQCATSPNHFTY